MDLSDLQKRIQQLFYQQYRRSSTEFNFYLNYDLKNSDMNVEAGLQQNEPWLGGGIGGRYISSIKKQLG